MHLGDDAAVDLRLTARIGVDDDVGGRKGGDQSLFRRDDRGVRFDQGHVRIKVGM